MRFFRDSYLTKQPGGQAEIEQYYAMAPGIVTVINQLPNAADIWNTIYEELVEPCVQMIHTHQNEEAYHLYKTYSLKLSKLYLGSKT